ncbi:MAG: nucleotide exchange factor GrpE [Bacteroidota bacterium]
MKEMKNSTKEMEKKQDKKHSENTADKSQNEAQTNEFPCDATEKDAVIAEQKAKIDELNDKYLRLYAEFDNYRKRTIKERIEMSKTAASEVISAMLPVLDDFERALDATPDDEATKALKDGIILIYQKYKSILTKNGLEEIKSIGETFNTDIHEAIANVPAQNNKMKGKIIDQVEKGYYLNGTILRFAKVVVAN